jgi:two-component system, cell cycle sensor histidine kinase and response regulator CckA
MMQSHTLRGSVMGVADKGREARARTGAQTILVVDDERGVRTLVGGSLHRAGYAVLEASTAREALEFAQHFNEPIHLIITDLGLPDLDGRELACRFSLIRPEAKVILMSGSITPDASTHKPFLKKPFALRDLIGNVRAVIDI